MALQHPRRPVMLQIKSPGGRSSVCFSAGVRSQDFEPEALLDTLQAVGMNVPSNARTALLQIGDTCTAGCTLAEQLQLGSPAVKQQYGDAVQTHPRSGLSLLTATARFVVPRTAQAAQQEPAVAEDVVQDPKTKEEDPRAPRCRQLISEILTYVAYKQVFKSGDLIQLGQPAKGKKKATGDAVVPEGKELCLVLIKEQVRKVPAAQPHDHFANHLLAVFCARTKFDMKEAKSLYYR
jgi:hypothetical protein